MKSAQADGCHLPTGRGSVLKPGVIYQAGVGLGQCPLVTEPCMPQDLDYGSNCSPSANKLHV